MPPTTSEVLRAIDCSRDDYYNWRKRIFVGTERYPEMTQAKEPIGYFPALLVGYMTALVKAGFEPSEAASRAEVYAVLYKARSLAQWLISFPSTDVEIHCGDKGAETSILAAFNIPSPREGGLLVDAVPMSDGRKRKHTVANIVNLTEIGARIDDLFQESIATSGNL